MANENYAANNPKAPGSIDSAAEILRSAFDKDLSAFRVVQVTGVGFTTTSTSTSSTTSTTTTTTQT
jgi:hypothetical protein